jgi:hypothetical protein
MTTRTANVLATNSSANGIVTAAALWSDAPADNVTGTAAPENARAAASSPGHDFSRPRAARMASTHAGAIGASSDQRSATSMVSITPAAAATPTARVHPSHRIARCRKSRLARAPRAPLRTMAGSCARKPANTAVATSSPVVDTPAARKAVIRGTVICPYAPCSLGNSDLLEARLLTPFDHESAAVDPRRAVHVARQRVRAPPE